MTTYFRIMATAWPAVNRPPQTQFDNAQALNNRFLAKKINSEKDVIHFKTTSAAYKNIQTYVDLICERICGTGNKVLNHKYIIESEIFQRCSNLLDELALLCDNTDLSQAKGSAPLRFGHIAFRDWFDAARVKCRDFINTQLASEHGEQLREELLTYLAESFGNRTRIDYGTGHELNFLLFTMGLSCLSSHPGEITDEANKNNHDGTKSGATCGATSSNKVDSDRLKNFVAHYGWDILALFAHKYLRLCRKVQVKFRLEPAGSRGVYNMDDFQCLPFLFGAAQLVGNKYITTKKFYHHENVDMFKNDFIFLEAVDFILNNKRGPFHEHSYTLWCLIDLGSWENIYRRIRMKFTNDVLSPFPIVQHLLFGAYILRWDDGDKMTDKRVDHGQEIVGDGSKCFGRDKSSRES